MIKTRDMRWLKSVLLVSIENMTQDGLGHRQGKGALTLEDCEHLCERQLTSQKRKQGVEQ